MNTPKDGGPAICPTQRGTIRSELLLMSVLIAIVHETMDDSPVRPLSGSSYLPAELIEAAQVALAGYGLRISPEAHQRVEPGGAA
jgi:hypothetical protein